MKNIFRLVRLSGLLFVVFCLFSTTNLLHAQWIQTNGPYGGTVQALAVSPNGAGGTNLFAGTLGGGVFLSTNNGTSWSSVNTGLTFTYVYSLAVSESNLFAGVYGGGVYLSTNNGTSWTAASTGLTNNEVFALVVSPNGAGGTNLFAGTNGGGVFLSTNNGTSWSAVNAGLTNTTIQALTVSGTNLFAGTHGGVFLSTNNGTSWAAVNTGLTSTLVYSLAASGTNLFAGAGDGGVYLSTNNGTSWTAVNSGLTNNDVRALAVYGTNLFAGTWGGVFLSTNNGTSWTAVNTGLTNNDVLSLAVFPNGAGGTNLFAGTYIGGIFLSTNNGTNWSAVNTGLTNYSAQALIVSGTNLFTGSWGVYLSTNSGISWTAVNTGLSIFTWVYALAVSPNGAGGTNLFAGTWGGGVFLSTNNGTSWTAVNTGLTNNDVLSLAVSPNGAGDMNLFAGTWGGGVFLSTNNGTSWTAVNSGSTNTNVHSLAVSGTNLFAGTGGGGVFLSTNNGTSWTAVNSGLTNTNVHSLAVSGTNLFAGTDDGGVFLSTNNGTSWTAVNTGLMNNSVLSFAVSGTNLFAGTPDGVFLSTNNGTSWTAVNTGLPLNTSVYAFAVSGTNLFAGTNSMGVWRRPLSEMIAPVILSVDSVTTYSNDRVLVPVRVIFPSGESYSSAELRFGGFQHNGLSFLGLDTTLSMMNNKGWQILFNNTDTLLITASAGAQDITGSGVLFNLTFDATGNPCTFVPITIMKAVFNTGVDSVAVSNGGVHIKAVPVYGDVDGNGQVQAYDASLILKSLVGETTLGCQALANAIVNCQDTLMAYDATLILQNVVKLITLPSCSVVEAAGNLTMPDTLATGSSSFAVPINLSNGSNILSFEGAVDYDTSALHFDGIDWGASLGSFSKEAKAEKGRIMMAAASATADGRTGVFVSLNFTRQGSVAKTTITLKKSRWNAGKVVQNVGSCVVMPSALGVPIANSGYPTEFSLSQNFPNPFNPTTSIRFALPRSSYVTLQVFNLLGQEVAVLVNQGLQAGYHEAVWDASKMPSGMYFYRLQAGAFTETKKLVLLR